MSDGKANYGFLGVDWWALTEHLVTIGNHETAHGSPILRFGMECGEAQPCSMEPQRL